MNVEARKCADCDGPRDRPSYSYCRSCHRVRMKRFRARQTMTVEQRRKDNVRSHANTYKRRGIIVQQPCAKCGDPNSQMHHHDYGRPTDVEWLCSPCHLEWHKRCLSLVKSAFRQWAGHTSPANVKREAAAENESVAA